MDWSQIRYFTEAEMTCKCGCGRSDMDEVFMRLLNQLRSVLGKPMTVTSGFRCPAYNSRVARVERSAHTLGLAADIAAPDGAYTWRVVDLATGMAFSGIGIDRASGSHGFVHLDVLARPCNVVWTYQGPWVF